MEKKTARPLTPSTNNSVSPPVLPTVQPFPWATMGQADEWDLRNFLSLVRRRALVILGVATTVMGMVVISTFSQKPVYEGRFQLLVEPVNANNDLSDITNALGSLDKANLNKTSLDYDTQIQVLRSPELMEAIVNQIKTVYPEIDYGTLVRNLTIVRPGETKILEVRYRANNPDQIQLILTYLSKSYLEYSLIDRQTNLRQGIQFIDKQLPLLQGQVEQLQNELQMFRQQNNFIDPESQAGQISSTKSNLDQQRLAIDQELAKARSYFATLQGESGGVAALNDAAVYQQLIGELRKVETDTAAELTRFKEQNINIQVLRQRRENLLPLLKQEAQRVLGTKLAEAVTQIQILEVRSQTLNQAQKQLDQQIQRLPALARQYTDLQGELQLATQGLTRFLESRQTLQIKAAQTEIPWQVIQAPTRPTDPVSPNIPRSLMLGGVASLLLGFGAALLLEKLDNVYHTVEDLKEKTKLPVLGTLPLSRELTNTNEVSILEQLVQQLYQTIPILSTLDRSSSPYRYYGYGASSFLEALRVFHTNLQLLSSDRPIRAITISSAMPGDGKSTVSMYLAQTAVAMGQRVLLVDADLRKPQIHNRLNVSNQQGLSQLISTNLSIKEALQRVRPNFYVLTAGSIPPDSTKLLSSQKMQNLMEEFYKLFDLVIYDTPPIVGLADASLLAPRTDGLILVVRLAKTDRGAIAQGIDSLKMAQTPILGLVANGMPNSAFGSYNYYRYGYGQESSIGRNSDGDVA